MAYIKEQEQQIFACNEAWKIWLWASDKNIRLSAIHILGKANCDADHQSRHFETEHECLNILSNFLWLRISLHPMQPIIHSSPSEISWSVSFPKHISRYQNIMWQRHQFYIHAPLLVWSSLNHTSIYFNFLNKYFKIRRKKHRLLKASYNTLINFCLFWSIPASRPCFLLQQAFVI